MLKCVLANVVDWSGFLLWMRADAARAQLFTTPKVPPFTAIDLSSTSSAIDSTTERLYSVRCEIVHSKEGASSAPPIAAGIADAAVEPELPLMRHLAAQAIRNGRRL